jgi:chemotaxis protein CheC
MELTAVQKDALTELINIGYGRAAAALSELTGYRIQLQVPEVTMHPIEDLSPLLEDVIDADVASVTQRFSGPIAGNAFLLLEEPAAASLSHLLLDDGKTSGVLDAGDREVITEVGNILLNACLGVFGNILKIQVTFAVPRLQVQSIRRVLADAAESVEERVKYGLMIHTRFHIRDANVSGFLVIILGVLSLDRLLLELDAWEQRQEA